MRFKLNLFSLVFFSFLFLLFTYNFSNAQAPDAVESAQQISDFSLSGYGEKGKKSWELSGRSADIFDDIVKLQDVEGRLYGKEEDVQLSADKGDFNKAESKVHLQDNVVITTSSGAKLTTDSLEWDRKKELVTTKDKVSIQRDNMTVVARGAQGEPYLKKVALEKDVRLDIDPADKEKVIITCGGPLEVDYEKNMAIFNENVAVQREGAFIYSDKMIVYFTAGNKDKKLDSLDSLSGKIDKIIASGNVRVVRGENISYSDEAIYSARERKIILKGNPKLVITSAEGFKDAPFGN